MFSKLKSPFAKKEPKIRRTTSTLGSNSLAFNQGRDNMSFKISNNNDDSISQKSSDLSFDGNEMKPEQMKLEPEEETKAATEDEKDEHIEKIKNLMGM